MASRPQWSVKHGNRSYTFKTLREAREYARVLNATCGYDFTVISKAQERHPPLKIERELARLFGAR